MKKNLFLKKLPWLVPSLLVIGLGIYAIVELLISGLIPSGYGLTLAAAYALVSALVLFLTLRYFKTKGRRVLARTLAVLIMILVLLVSVVGLYAVKRSVDIIERVSTNEGAVSIQTAKSFNVYISGIDTYGDIGKTSRSDVNIVATVNPDTRKILLTTVPRDAYVSIALGGNDGMDKLTHAGNYGVESSMKTVARLLDTDIDAYVRINFTSFIESIDTIGGITVNNPVAFKIDGVEFPQGQLELDGKKALLYSRERKSLAGGDVDRGKNQQRVIEGVVAKMSSVRSVSGFESLLNMIGGSVQTNLSSSTLKQLINQQIAKPSGWSTESYTITGRGQTGGLPSYAMPGSQLYMYVLGEDSVTSAKDKIRGTLDSSI